MIYIKLNNFTRQRLEMRFAEKPLLKSPFIRITFDKLQRTPEIQNFFLSQYRENPQANPHQNFIHEVGPPEPEGGRGSRGATGPTKFLEINTKVGTGLPKVLKVQVVVAPPQRFLASVGPARVLFLRSSFEVSKKHRANNFSK